MKANRFKFLKYIFLPSFFLLFGGCVHVTTHTKVNNDYASNIYNKLVVICTDDDSDVAAETENHVGDFLKKNKLEWITFFPFSQNYYEGSDSNNDSFKRKLDKFIAKNKIDGILFITNGNMSLSSYVTGMTTYRNGYTSLNGVNVKSMALKMELYDATTRDSVWYSKGGSSSSSILRGKQDLINFFVNDSMKKLADTGLLDEKR